MIEKGLLMIYTELNW